MEHVAILKKEWLAKILSGKKTIESRWYKYKKTPYKAIKKGDVIYLKEVGKPVCARVVAGKVLFFNNLDQKQILGIINRYGKQIGLSRASAGILSGKKFCTLIFLEEPEKISLFNINKQGYGLMSAWISVKDVSALKLKKTRRL